MIQEVDREVITFIRSLLLEQEKRAKELSSKFNLLVKRLEELESAGVAFSDAHYYNEDGNWEVLGRYIDEFENVLGYQ
jgi:hypothetical protein